MSDPSYPMSCDDCRKIMDDTKREACEHQYCGIDTASKGGNGNNDQKWKWACIPGQPCVASKTGMYDTPQECAAKCPTNGNGKGMKY